MAGKDLEGRTALVTGAQQGIGRSIAIAFAAAGADVAINYLDNLDAAKEEPPWPRPEAATCRLPVALSRRRHPPLVPPARPP